jgi:hypothetical protein
MDVPIWAEFVPAGMRWEGLQGSPLLSGQRVGEYSVVSFAVPGESLKGALPERVLMHSDRIEEIGALATAHPGARLLLGFVTEAVKEAYAPRSVLVWPSGEVLFVGGCGRDAYTGMMNQLSSAAGTDSGSLLRAHIAGVLFLDGLAEELDTEPEAGG